MGFFGSLGKRIAKAFNGDDDPPPEPRVYGRGQPHRQAEHKDEAQRRRASEIDVIRATVAVDDISALEQLHEHRADLVLADALERDGGVQGAAQREASLLCDGDGEIADGFYVQAAGGRFERADATPLPLRPAL